MDPEPKAKRKKRRKGSLLPDTRTVRKLSEMGWLADIVERRLTFAVKKDWLGIADVLAISQGGVVLLVQATDRTHVANRVTKLLENQHVPRLLRAGVWIQVWGWTDQVEDHRMVALTLNSMGSIEAQEVGLGS